MQNKLAQFILISSVFLFTFVALFLLRGVDDNSLFRWSWVFAQVDASRIYLYILIGLIISFFLSRTAVPDYYQIPFLAVLSFAVSALFWKEPEIIVDASRYFSQAKHLEVYGIGYFLKEWGGMIPAWTDMPLIPVLFGLLFKLFGESRTVIQIFTSTLFALTTVLTYLIGKKLWNRETGFAGGLLLLGIPYLLTQVPLMLVDVPTMFFLALSVFTFLDALAQDGVARIVCSVAAIICTVVSKYSAWFMLSVLGVVLLVYTKHSVESKGHRPLERGLLILLIAAAVSGAALLFKLDVVSEQIAFLLEYQKPGLSRWGESFQSTFLFQMHPFITVSAMVSVVVAWRKRDMRYAIISWLILLVVVFTIRRIRYLVPVFPLFTLMAGYGLQIMRREDITRFIVYGVVTTSLVIAVFAYRPLAENMSAGNLQHAGAYLNTLDGGEIEVITLPPEVPVVNHAVGVPLLDLFTNKRIQYFYRQGAFPPHEEIESSPLRFTWEYRNPAYYSAPVARAGDAPIVILSDASNSPLTDPVSRRLEGYRLSKSFNVNEGIFRYTVGVRVYQSILSVVTPPE